MALRRLGVNFEHVFSCEVDELARAAIRANFRPHRLFRDITTRDPRILPEVDLYIAGFPCQTFSTQGLREGFGDAQGRGLVFGHILEYLRHRRPRTFLLENVPGLLSVDDGGCFRAVLRELERLRSYNVYWKVIHGNICGSKDPRLALRDASGRVVRAGRACRGPGHRVGPSNCSYYRFWMQTSSESR